MPRVTAVRSPWVPDGELGTKSRKLAEPRSATADREPSHNMNERQKGVRVQGPQAAAMAKSGLSDHR